MARGGGWGGPASHGCAVWRDASGAWCCVDRCLPNVERRPCGREYASCVLLGGGDVRTDCRRRPAAQRPPCCVPHPCSVQTFALSLPFSCSSLASLDLTLPLPLPPAAAPRCSATRRPSSCAPAATPCSACPPAARRGSLRAAPSAGRASEGDSGAATRPPPPRRERGSRSAAIAAAAAAHPPRRRGQDALVGGGGGGARGREVVRRQRRRRQHGLWMCAAPPPTQPPPLVACLHPRLR